MTASSERSMTLTAVSVPPENQHWKCNCVYMTREGARRKGEGVQSPQPDGNIWEQNEQNKSKF